jgi:glyoxylase-like metal-dependent hydrolase (beta-lactamase superfamily II)/8-oxo-dGTP pyrophosphatase MutT (NUDIX family)
VTAGGPSEVRPASTLVILRPGPEGPEVLLTVRPPDMRFMAGATVFPGGAGGPSDEDPRWERASRLDRHAARERLPDAGDQALSFFVCALREAFEEVGFLAGDGPLERLGRKQGEASLLEECLAAGVRLATDELVSAGRWVTPQASALRFDTRFFAVRAPEEWKPAAGSEEVADCDFVTAREALGRLARGRIIMAPPTVAILQRLDGRATVEEALDALSTRRTGQERVISARISPLVHVIIAPNPGLMTGPGTNTYVVGRDPSLVVDPAVEDEEYLEAVASAAGDVRAILVTHRHEDHIGGVAALADRSGAPVRAWGNEPLIPKGTEQHLAGKTSSFKGEAPSVTPLMEGEDIAFGGGWATALHTPGHASDHVCYLIPAEQALVAGDCVLGEGTPVIAPPDGNMRSYLATLERLEQLDVERIYPGHFRPRDDARGVIHSLRAHRKEREALILQALAGGARSLEEVVTTAYEDTPEALLAVAELSARAHLDLLVEEERVVPLNGGWKVADNNRVGGGRGVPEK